MEHLYKLAKSKVTTSVPFDSEVCQPFYYAPNQDEKDPFEDVLELESLIERPYPSEPTLKSLFDAVLFALDGKYKLLSREDADKCIASFVKDMESDMTMILRKARWKVDKIEDVQACLRRYWRSKITPEFIEFLCLHLKQGITLREPGGKNSKEYGWDQFKGGMVLDIINGKVELCKN